ncbi:MAG: hypothetical protein G8345_03965 [Magnetococcales bacterium]|nr:hypothetical protein [Magnetococcales bacterium]
MNALQLVRVGVFCLLFSTLQTALANDDCLRCHGMATLALRDPVTGSLTDYHIQPADYQKSLHGKLTCDKCHKEGFDTYPHEPAAIKKADNCLDCHKGAGPWQNLRLPAIADQYARSVHFKGFQDQGGCFTCHNLHKPDTMGQNITLNHQVQRANQRCQECHNTQAGTDKPNSLLASHRWLPETARHLQEVRCVDCHSPDLGSAVHAIGPAKRAQMPCESCHGKNSLLTAKLYRHQVLQERQKVGFMDSLLLNEAYVIGMTRYPWLDWGSLALLVITLLGLIGHGLARVILGRKNHEHHH